MGFIAAWKSHTLADPPIPNFYSPHSFLGGAALLLLLGQVGLDDLAVRHGGASSSYRQTAGLVSAAGIVVLPWQASSV